MIERVNIARVTAVDLTAVTAALTQGIINNLCLYYNH